MTPDGELLRRYAETGSEEAFGELVRRHLDLVHSAALRQVNGDAHLAEDVAQGVFADLARKAGTLSRREGLTGWLYTSARYAALKAVRAESRRRARETQTMRDAGGIPGTDPDWERLRPLLDQVMHELREPDREAILLRYFEGRPLAEVGERLGLSGNAARMRVDRALEKLRAALARRGLGAAATLASVLEANAVQPAPAGLAGALSRAALAGGGGGGGALTALKFMATANLKTGVTALVIAGLAATLVWQYQSAARLRSENDGLRGQLAKLRSDNDGLLRQAAAAKAALRLRLPAPALPPGSAQADPSAADGQRLDLYDRFLKGKIPTLTAEQLAGFLKANHRDAGSLLGAFRATQDPALLREAMQKFPNDPQVGFEASQSGYLTPGERRDWLTRWEQSDPDNSLANYLSAANYLANGQTDLAVQELTAATGKSQFNDYSVGRVEDDKEAYLGAGYSDAEATTLASSQLLLPQLGPLKQLELGMVDLSKTYQQAGDADSAQSALQMGVELGQRYDTQTPGEAVISELVGIAAEKIALNAMDPNSPYGDSGQTVQDALNQLAQQRAAITQRDNQVEPLLPQLTDNDWVIYKDIWLQSGEEAAQNWVIGKYGRK